MNLWMRFFKVLLFSRFRSKIAPLDEAAIDFRVWVPDLDVLRHMNNGRYLTLMDLGRIDLMIRCGLAAKLEAAGYYPVVAEETIRFRRSLGPFQKFTLKSKVIGWDDKFFVMRQEFWVRDQRFAAAFIKARFLKKTGGSVAPSEIMSMAGLPHAKAPHPTFVSDWNQFGAHFDADFSK